jgi:tetratricopeptide (TPR) repeat protein
VKKYLALISLLSLLSIGYHPTLSLALLTTAPARIDARSRSYLPQLARKNNYTGVVKRVDDIAQQITVRIENSQGNGSGVIIARTGNTYYVATAAHVVTGKGYSIVTPTRERVTVKQIIVPEPGTDVAIVKFKSTQNYRVAKIGTDRFGMERGQTTTWVFLSGFPARDPRNRRILSIGRPSVDPSLNDFAFAKDTLPPGYDLLYTNLSLPGMSGGAVLDTQGRLVGINNAAENQQGIEAGKQIQINSGYALGVPISTLLRAAKTSLPQLSRDLTPVPVNTPADNAQIERTLLASLASPRQTATARAWLDYGNLLWRSLKYAESVTAFDRSLKLLAASDSPDRDLVKLAYYGRGLSLIQLKQPQLAVTALQQAVKVDDRFMPAYKSLAYALSASSRDLEAVAAMQKAIESSPKNNGLYISQGLNLFKLKRYSAAFTAFNIAIDLQPNNYFNYFIRSLYSTKLKNYPQALADIDRAIQLDPQDATLYYVLRGNIYGYLRQYSRSIVDYTKAIELTPDLAMTYAVRGATYTQQKQYSRSLTDLNKAIQLGDKNPITYASRGEVYRLQKQSTSALADYTTAIQLNPKYVDAYNERGTIYTDSKQYPEALADYTKAIQINPQYLNGYNNRGNLYIAQQQYSLALADFNKLLELDPKYASGYINRGVVYFVQKQYALALTDCNKAIQLDPQNAIAYINRGEIYYEMGDRDKAIQAWQQSIALDPKLAEPQLALAVALYTQGDRERAYTTAQSAIGLDKNLAKIQYLKEQNWGDRLLADAQKLLDAPRMKAFTSRNNNR